MENKHCIFQRSCLDFGTEHCNDLCYPCAVLNGDRQKPADIRPAAEFFVTNNERQKAG